MLTKTVAILSYLLLCTSCICTVNTNQIIERTFFTDDGDLEKDVYLKLLHRKIPLGAKYQRLVTYIENHDGSCQEIDEHNALCQISLGKQETRLYQLNYNVGLNEAKIESLALEIEKEQSLIPPNRARSCKHRRKPIIF